MPKDLPAAALPDLRIPLTAEQQAIMHKLVTGVRVLFQQVPAGTGKTYVVGEFVRELFDSLFVFFLHW